MNILFYSYFGFDSRSGGVARVSNLLAEEFLRKGHNVFYITKARRVNYDAEYVPLVEETELPDPDMGYTEPTAEFFADYVRKRKIDVIICQNYDWDHMSPYMAKKATGAKLLYVFHSTPLSNGQFIADTSWPIFDSEKGLLKHLRRLFRTVFAKWKQGRRNRETGEQIRIIHDMGDGVVFLAPVYVDVARDISGLPDTGKFFSIANPNTYREEEIVECPKENTLLFLGRVSREKNPEKALLLWKHLQNRFPEWNIKIVGGGDVYDEVVQLKEKWKLERCYIEGWQEAAPYYQKAKIFLMLSDFEGFPMAMTEAMQHGVVPIVFNSFGALESIITDGETGISVKAFDLKEYESKLSSLMADEARLAAMSAAAKLSTRRFEKSEIASQWLELFGKI